MFEHFLSGEPFSLCFIFLEGFLQGAKQTQKDSYKNKESIRRWDCFMPFLKAKFIIHQFSINKIIKLTSLLKFVNFFWATETNAELLLPRLHKIPKYPSVVYKLLLASFSAFYFAIQNGKYISI